MKWIRFCIVMVLSFDLLSAKKSPPVSPSITLVQAFLRSRQETPSLTVTGKWDASTQETIRSYILHLQGLTLWGNTWQGAQNGAYSLAFSEYLQDAIDGAAKHGVDPGEIETFRSFVDAMEELRQAGFLAGPADELTPVDADSPLDEDRDSASQEKILYPLLLSFANGALSGFGDEAYCAAFSAPATFSECHADAKKNLDRFDAQNHGLAIAMTLIGSMVNVISLILSLIAIETETSPAGVLVLSFVMGFVDCLLYSLGDAWTATQVFALSGFWKELKGQAGPIFIMSLCSGFVMAWVVARHRWKSKHPPEIKGDAAFEAFWGQGSKSGGF